MSCSDRDSKEASATSAPSSPGRLPARSAASRSMSAASERSCACASPGVAESAITVASVDNTHRSAPFATAGGADRPYSAATGSPQPPTSGELALVAAGVARHLAPVVDAGVPVDDQAALGVEQRAVHLDRAIGRGQHLIGCEAAAQPVGRAVGCCSGDPVEFRLQRIQRQAGRGGQILDRVGGVNHLSTFSLSETSGDIHGNCGPRCGGALPYLYGEALPACGNDVLAEFLRYSAAEISAGVLRRTAGSTLNFGGAKKLPHLAFAH